MKTAGAFGGPTRQALILASGPINNMAFAVAQLAVFKARATSISESIRKERATRKKSQLTTARKVAMKMGRRLRCSSVTYPFRYAPLLAPCRQPILIAAKAMLVLGQDTGSIFYGALVEE